MRLFFLFFIAISNLSYSYENNQLLLHNPPKKIGYIEFESLNGSKKDFFKEEKKKIYLLNFWATWCPPCIKEIPELIKLKKKFKNEIEIIFVSVDSNPNKAIPKFLKKHDFKDIILFIDKKLTLSKKLDVKKMPTTILINDKLEEISRVEGYINWLDELILEDLAKLL